MLENKDTKNSSYNCTQFVQKGSGNTSHDKYRHGRQEKKSQIKILQKKTILAEMKIQGTGQRTDLKLQEKRQMWKQQIDTVQNKTRRENDLEIF